MATRSNALSRSTLSRFVLALGLVGWVLSPLSTKASGAAWLALIGAALLSCGLERRADLDPTVLLATRRWWWLTAAACALASLAIAGHGDAWASLQDNARLCLGASAVLWLLPRWSADNRVPNRLMSATALACVVAAAVAMSHDRNQLPSNAIPWAVAVAMLLCLLAPAVLERAAPWPPRRGWAIGLVLGVFAVLASQTRGALVILPWLAWLLLRHVWQHRPTGAPRSIAALLVAVAVLGSSAWWESDPLRLREAGEDVMLAWIQNDPNTAVGARLAMWTTAAEGIAQAPWWGHGIAGREAAMHALGQQHDARIWSDLSHFHNEYLNAWFDHGVPGLGAVLLTLLGLVAAARALRHTQPVASQQLWGLAVVHGVAGLSNVNTAHNLYTLALSLAASVVLLRAAQLPPSIDPEGRTP